VIVLLLQVKLNLIIQLIKLCLRFQIKLLLIMELSIPIRIFVYIKYPYNLLGFLFRLKDIKIWRNMSDRCLFIKVIWQDFLFM